MSTIISIAGKDGSGKRTLAGRLAPYFGDCCLMAFATGLREEAIAQGILTREEAYRKPTSPRVRRILREFSTMYKQQKGSNIWANHLLERMPRTPVVIVHDTRYIGEIGTIRYAADQLISIFVGSAELSDEEKTEPSFKHLPAIRQMADLILPYRCLGLDNDELITVVKGLIRK